MEVLDLLVSTMIVCFLFSGGLAFIGTIARLDVLYTKLPPSFYPSIFKAIGLTVAVSMLCVIALTTLPLKRNVTCLEASDEITGQVRRTVCVKERFESLYLGATGWQYQLKTIIRRP